LDVDGNTSTRERILKAASRLIASRGYAGTSTRDIAEAVQIRQPSLFHHFRSKAAIVDALLEHSLGQIAGPMSELAHSESDASSRLYGCVYFDTRFLASSPYSLAGLFTDEIMESPEFSRWKDIREDLHESVREMVRQGIEDEEFISIDVDFAQRLITALNVITMNMHSDRQKSWAAQFADDVATFALRGLLNRISDLPEVRRSGVQIADQLDALVAEHRLSQQESAD